MNKNKNGFGLRLIYLVFLVLLTVAAVIVGIEADDAYKIIDEDINPFARIVTGIILIPAVFGAFFGRKSKCANVLTIISGVLFFLGNIATGVVMLIWPDAENWLFLIFHFAFSVIGIFGMVGGAKGWKSFEYADAEKLSSMSEYARNSVPKGAPSNDAAVEDEPWRQEYPVDYINKPFVSRLIDPDCGENLVYENSFHLKTELMPLFATTYCGNLYAYVLVITLDGVTTNKATALLIDYENDTAYFEQDKDVCAMIEEIFTKKAHSGAARGGSALRSRVSSDGRTGTIEGEYDNDRETISITRSQFRLDLYDASIDEQTWKQFKKTAPQEELAVIALGAKYRIVHGRIMNLLFVAGIIASIALIWATEFMSLIGYAVCAFLATKSIRYEDTFKQSYKKLDAGYKAFVDRFLRKGFGWKILDWLISLFILYATIPYQAIMMLIGMVAPNFVISKNGILVSIPEGFDIEGLGDVGDYYASFNFLDEAEATVKRAEEQKKAQFSHVIQVDGRNVYVNEQPYTKDGHKVHVDEYGKEYYGD